MRRRLTSSAVFVLLVACAWATARVAASQAAQATAPAQAQGAPNPRQVDPRVARLVSQVSADRITETLKKLQGFATRNTLSSTDSPTTGIGAARQWIFDQMKASSPRLQVSFDTYQVARQGERIPRDVELRNVMAVLPGRSPRRVYISGHYDSFARREGQKGAITAADFANVDNPAPGDNDDGSGTAAVIELARVFGQSGVDFDATLVFIAFAGEEEGLIGAKLHAQKAAADKTPIDAVLNNDMIGNIEGGDGIVDSETVRVFSEGPEDSPSRQLARYISRQGARYVPYHHPTLIARYDRFGRGGDHSAFNEYGFTAVRITEANENYDHQHTVRDTFEGVSVPYLVKNARLNASILASLALAPPAPAVDDARGRPMLDRLPSGYDAHLRWRPSPGAVAYKIFWRDGWSPDWQHEMTVGNVNETTLPSVSIDDYVFGVAAIGSEGNESLVSAYVNPPRGASTVKTVGSDKD